MSDLKSLTNSAERFAAMEATAARRALFALGAKRIAIIGTLLAIALGAFHAGQSHERTKAANATRRVLADTSKAVEQRMAARDPLIARETKAAAIAVARHDTAARAFDQHVTIVNDSTVRVDSEPPTHEVPAALAIPEIQTCRAALERVELARTVTAAQLVDMTNDRDAWRTRAELDESEHSRVGLKTGIAIGASAIALLVHVLK